MTPWAIHRLSKAVENGAVIAYPTDTIWGFGCHPRLASSVIKILDIKQRPVTKGLILLSSQLEYCAPYIDPNLLSEQTDLIKPGDKKPTTWLVPAAESCPIWLRGRFPTIALRITSHPFIDAICDQMKSPLVSTSANRHRRSTVRSALQARRQFGEELDFVVTGFNTGTNRASEIKLLVSGEVVRSSAV
jgi:L-threonylcarbamoyladenylate synthase